MVQPPSASLFNLPSQELFATLQGELEILPGYHKGACVYVQANATGDEVDIRLQNPDVRGLTFRHVVGKTPCIYLKRGQISFNVLGGRTTLEYAPDPILSNPSKDKRSHCKTHYVCKLAIGGDCNDWRCEWLRVRTTTQHSARVVLTGKSTSGEPTQLDETSLEYKTSIPQTTFPEELLKLERWLTGRSRLPELALRTDGANLILSTSNEVKAVLQEMWGDMQVLRKALDLCLPNLAVIAKSVQITPQNCSTARDCASIFLKT